MGRWGGGGQAEEEVGAPEPMLDERAHMPLHAFFYEHLRKKYVLL